MSCLAKVWEQPVRRSKDDWKRSTTLNRRLTAPMESPFALMRWVEPSLSMWKVAVPAGKTRQSTPYESVWCCGRYCCCGAGSGGDGCARQTLIARRLRRRKDSRLKYVPRAWSPFVRRSVGGKRALLKRKKASMPDEQFDQQHCVNADRTQSGMVLAVESTGEARARYRWATGTCLP